MKARYIATASEMIRARAKAMFDFRIYMDCKDFCLGVEGLTLWLILLFYY